MIRCLLVMMMVLLASPAVAQAYLEPDAMLIENEWPPGLGRDYAERLAPWIGPNARVFEVVEGGFVSASVVGLRKTDSGYVIFTASERPGQLPTNSEAQIDQALAQRIIAAWDKVVLQSRFQAGKPDIGADGAIEHFASHLTYRIVAGKAWAPHPPGNPGWLARIGSGLSQICSPGRVQSVPDALREIEEALQHIQ